jgi:hypothetical protein
MSDLFPKDKMAIGQGVFSTIIIGLLQKNGVDKALYGSF